MRRHVRSLLKRLRRIKRLDDLATSLFTVWFDLPVHPFQYYSPMPDLPAVNRNRGRWFREGYFANIPLDSDEQSAFLRRLHPYSPECATLPSFAQVMGGGFGQG